MVRVGVGIRSLLGLLLMTQSKCPSRSKKKGKETNKGGKREAKKGKGEEAEGREMMPRGGGNACLHKRHKCSEASVASELFENHVELHIRPPKNFCIRHSEVRQADKSLVWRRAISSWPQEHPGSETGMGVVKGT